MDKREATTSDFNLGDETSDQIGSTKAPQGKAEKAGIKKIRPIDVLKAIRPHFNGQESVAMNEIARAIREGELRISAYSCKSEVPPSKTIWAEGRPANIKRRLVRRQKFIGCKNWAADAKNWKWKSSNFFLTQNKGRGWTLLHKVRFREGDVRTYIERLKSEKIGKGGVSKRTGGWMIACLRIAEMARDGEFTVETLGREKVFSRALREGLPPHRDLNLSDSALKPLNEAVRDYFLPIVTAEAEQKNQSE